MFRPSQAAEAFQHYLSSGEHALAALTPLEAFECFFRFYAHRRAEGVDLSADGDQLVLQWGSYDWGEGRRFEVALARQLLPADAGAGPPHRLELGYAFTPTPALDALGAGSRWCPGPDEVSAFAEWVRAHPALRAVGMRSDGERSLVLEAG